MTAPYRDPAALKQILLSRAEAEAFDVVRVTRPDAIPHAPGHLAAFLDDGHHGTMDWMAERIEWRSNPGALWPQARSVIMLGQNYGPARDPRHNLRKAESGHISVYAQGDDYHEVMKGKLKRLAQWFAHASGAEVKVFVDTAPVMEKPLAEAAGLGWQGKHTNLVSRDFGSWLFLGSIFTTLELPVDGPERNNCGSCRACLAACPTNAFPAPYKLDARRCISYLTIEHKGPIPGEFRQAMGNRIYGCDDCLAACPWNKFAQEAREMRLRGRPELDAPHLAELLALDDAAFRTLFRKSPVKRIGRDRFVRNTLIAAGNSGDAGLLPAVGALLGDPAPVVRGAAVWALSRLLPEDDFAALAIAHRRTEDNVEVQAEWDRRAA
jgi:epoxyqueuosine reductase